MSRVALRRKIQNGFRIYIKFIAVFEGKTGKLKFFKQCLRSSCQENEATGETPEEDPWNGKC